MSRARELWPVLAGLALGLAVLLAALDGRGGDRLLGVDVRGWLAAVLAVCAGLTVQLLVSARTAMQRERRLVYAAASMRELTSRLELLATTDTLTGLQNRRIFFERLGVEFRRSSRYRRPLAVVMADLDHFKEVNDRYGHPFGDLVISVTAQTIRTSVRESDLVARYGGEEFVLLLPETGLADAMVVAEKLRAAIAAQEFTNGIVSARLTLSLGVAAVPESAPADEADLVRLADEALYRAKRAGRDRAVAATPAITPDA